MVKEVTPPFEVDMDPSTRVLNEEFGGSLVSQFPRLPGEDGRYNIPGFKETTNFRPNYSNSGVTKKSRVGTISKFFSNMSRFGLNYDEDVISNMRAIPLNKNLIPKEQQLMVGDMYNKLTGYAKTNADKNFYDKDYNAKREALRKLALQPELEDILDTMCNEAVVFDSEHTYFAEPFVEEIELNDLKKKFQKRILTSLNTNYKKFYKMLNLRNEAWGLFKRWLVEGILSWEIIWDSLEKPTQIIGIVQVDPATLTRKFKDNKWYWIQFAGITGRERVLLESQIIYIAYDEGSALNRTSYLERLIRPYNIYRIIEQAIIIWTCTNASFKMQFTIPVKGMNTASGQQTLNSAMNRYREDINFNVDSGELKINGKSNMPFNKEYWMPESDSGSPSIQTLGGDGPDLNDNDQLKFFKNQLYKISKIPLNRFDQESSETWMGSDATSYLRTEIDFGRYVERLRNIFSMLLIKPLMQQVACDVPELEDNKQILEAIYLRWNSYNLFEEAKEQEVMQKRVEFIQTMKDSLVDMSPDGNDIKFFSSEFLVKKYLKLSDADIKLNEKLKHEEEERWNMAGGDEAHGEKNLDQDAEDPRDLKYDNDEDSQEHEHLVNS